MSRLTFSNVPEKPTLVSDPSPPYPRRQLCARSFPRVHPGADRTRLDPGPVLARPVPHRDLLQHRRQIVALSAASRWKQRCLSEDWVYLRKMLAGDRRPVAKHPDGARGRNRRRRGGRYSLPNSYPHMRMNQISIFLSNFHKGILKIFDLIEESHHESGVDV